jgi:hypothetical protein
LKRIPPDGQEANADDEDQQLVAVKVLKAGSDCHAREDLLHEAEIMASFQHRNILSLRGIVINGNSLNQSTVIRSILFIHGPVIFQQIQTSARGWSLSTCLTVTWPNYCARQTATLAKSHRLSDSIK